MLKSSGPACLTLVRRPGSVSMNAKRRIRYVLEGLAGFLLVLSGAARRASRTAFDGGGVTGIFFHNPGKRLFRKYVRWLKRNGYVFISSQELIQIMKHRSRPPGGAVWISFDDGWRGNLGNVVPTLLQYEIPATFFVSTSPVENSGVFWWTYARKYECELPDVTRNRAERLWCIGERERREIVEELERRFSQDMKREALTVEEIRHMSALPMVTIGSHTVHHPIMPNCTEEELEFQIRRSKELLEEWTGKEVNCFAYPNGDFSGKEIPFLKKNGYELAATTRSRLISSDDDRYLLPRLCGIDGGFFCRSLCGTLGVWLPFVEGMKRLMRSLGLSWLVGFLKAQEGDGA